MSDKNNKAELDELEKLMKSATENSEDLIGEDFNDDKKPNKFVPILIGTILSFSVIIAIGSSILKPQEFVNKTGNPEWVAEQREQELKLAETSYWDFDYPIQVPEWSKQSFNVDNVLEDEEIYEELLQYAKDIQEINFITSWMPSGVEGDWEDAPPAFTNISSEEFLQDGTPNPYYSYTLKEDYLIAYSTYIQRLINPAFGDWMFAQRATPSKPYKSNETYKVLRDMFSSNWWETNIIEGEDYTSLPILVDWEGDNFGGLEFAELVDGRFGTFYGVIDESEERFVEAEAIGQDKNNQEIIKITTPIKYSAFGKDDNLIDKYGSIELTLASNDNNTGLNNKVIITNAVLKID